MSDKKEYRSLLASGNVKAAKEEVGKMLSKESKEDVLKEIGDSNSMELLFHAYSAIKNDLGKSDVNLLLEVLQKMKRPILGGEEIAAYKRTRRDISAKIESITQINRSPQEIEIPENLDSFISKVKEWIKTN
jgi:hypothetical protein